MVTYTPNDSSVRAVADSVGVRVVGVAFSKTEVRPGVPDVRNDTVTATITPSDIPINFVTTNSRATVTPINGQGVVNFTVNGNTLSGANQDTQLQAWYNGQVLSSIPITVVEPDDYSSVLGPLIDTTPSIYSFDSTNKTVEWLTPVEITILDQFDIVLGSNWNGLTIQENVDNQGWGGFDATSTSPNASLFNGTIIDQVRHLLLMDNFVQALGIENCNIFPPGDSTATAGQFIRANLDNGADKILNGSNTRTTQVTAATKTLTTTNTH